MQQTIVKVLLEVSFRFFVLVYEHFENALHVLCKISIGPSTRLRPILNFPTFSQKGASLELLKIVYQKGFFGGIKKILNFSIWHQILDNYSQRLLNTAFSERPEKTMFSEDHNKTHKQ